MTIKKLFQYSFVFTLLYFTLGMFNILFAWLGMICFITPLLISIFMGTKDYCNIYCGRGRLYSFLGKKFSMNKPTPFFFKTPYFRYGFFIFFFLMFGSILLKTYYVMIGANNLEEIITLLWTFDFPWEYKEIASIPTWITQYAFGFYSLMLTTTILGLISMVVHKPRSFCVYCPMGTMTQGICKLKHYKKENLQ